MHDMYKIMNDEPNPQIVKLLALIQNWKKEEAFAVVNEILEADLSGKTKALFYEILKSTDEESCKNNVILLTYYMLDAEPILQQVLRKTKVEKSIYEYIIKNLINI